MIYLSFSNITRYTVAINLARDIGPYSLRTIFIIILAGVEYP